ncbi:hypothetical protein B296_00027800 [Ensete ventricosum]|uniref:Uncharacterized protein n=1 Tax=Ensete ventricosum TaxID=4639 RepID=A0A426ZAU7_ENSVE|nr:hypothetical protein B296_00027800 [Ensete ventricosum]
MVYCILQAQARKGDLRRIPEQAILSEVRRMVEQMQALNRQLEETVKEEEEAGKAFASVSRSNPHTIVSSNGVADSRKGRWAMRRERLRVSLAKMRACFELSSFSRRANDLIRKQVGDHIIVARAYVPFTRWLKLESSKCLTSSSSGIHANASLLGTSEATIEEYFKPIDKSAEIIMNMQLQKDEKQAKEMLKVMQEEAMIQREMAQKKLEVNSTNVSHPAPEKESIPSNQEHLK